MESDCSRHLLHQEGPLPLLLLRKVHPHRQGQWGVSTGKIIENGIECYSGDLKSGSPTIWNLNKWPQFCQIPFEICTKTSRFCMVGIKAIARAWAQQFWKLDYLKSVLQKSGFQMFPLVGFQIPTVVSFIQKELSQIIFKLTRCCYLQVTIL